MEIVLTHNNMDFDALAAQFGVTKLYPSARIVLGHPLVGNVRDFLALYRSSLPIVQVKYLDFDRVSRVFIVDCQHLDRLDDSAKHWIMRNQDRMRYTIFDHHEIDPAGLGPGAQPDSVIDKVGASTTILVEQIRKQKIKVSAFEATLLAIGIYEDTGCLTYSGTTERDASCLSFLLKEGADLEIVNDHIRPKLNDEQVHLLEDLVKTTKSIQIGGTRAVIATAWRAAYLDGLATLTRKLVEIESADAAFSVVHMRDRVHIVGRSDTDSIDVREVVRMFGGDGHRGAGSAVVKHATVEQIAGQLTDLLKTQVKPDIVASQIMSAPVRSVRPTVSMDEASRIMIRYGLDGLVVTENDKVVGVVSRRDIDQATHHKLGHAPVLGFMSRPVISIQPNATLKEIQQLMVKEDIGRLPVLDDNERLIGLVSRHDVLKTLYGRDSTDFENMVFGGGLISAEDLMIGSGYQDRDINLKDKMLSLDPQTQWLCEQLGIAAQKVNMVTYAVGGFVRDLMLGMKNFDLDFVIEGSAIEIARLLEEEFPDQLKVVAHHDRFQTATLHFLSDHCREVDLSTARVEYYDFPAALPTVEASSLAQDLSRRDFTINALAACVNPDKFGNLVDHFGGLRDLKGRVIRILHPFSFIEDPTRIIRAARFASRLGFHLEPKTKEQAKRAINMGIFDDLGGVRMRAELRLILESQHRHKALDLLSELGGNLRYLDSELKYNQHVKTLIRRAEQLLKRFPVKESWIVYLALLLSQLNDERLRGVLDRLYLANDHKDIIIEGVSIPKQLSQFSRDLKRSEIYELLHGKSQEALAVAACTVAPGSPLRKMIRLYLTELQETKIEISGAELVKLGYIPGPQFGSILKAVHNAKLDRTLATRDDELAFVAKSFPMGAMPDN